MTDEEEFQGFWEKFPRKEARKDALKAWRQLTGAQRFRASAGIEMHVRYWQVSGRTKQYIPLCASWLRGERFDDELEMPEVKSGDEWWKTRAGIEAKAREVGCWPAKSNEDWHSLKARILAKERAA